MTGLSCAANGNGQNTLDRGGHGVDPQSKADVPSTSRDHLSWSNELQSVGWLMGACAWKRNQPAKEKKKTKTKKQNKKRRENYVFVALALLIQELTLHLGISYRGVHYKTISKQNDSSQI